MENTFAAAVHIEVLKLCTALWKGGPELEASGPNLKVDGYVMLIFCLILFLMNWGVRLLVVTPIAKIALSTPKTKTNSKAFKAKVIRFAQSTMEAIFYGGFTLLGIRIVPSQPWVWPSKHWWINFQSGEHSIMRNDLRCYYLLYCARYVQGMISVFLEPKRKDFIEMQIHHFVTIAVVLISYLYGWNRIGAVVMLLLDPADVPLHLAKIQKYIGEANAKARPRLAHICEFGADRTFELFAVVFFITRVLMYPYVCWSAHIEATRYFPKGLPEWTCVALLEILYILQLYWFSLIVKVAIKLITKGHVEDVRSDDEDEEEDKID